MDQPPVARRIVKPPYPELAHDAQVEGLVVVRARVDSTGRVDQVVLERSVIVGVGTLMFFADLDGNVFGAMQYDTAAE